MPLPHAALAEARTALTSHYRDVLPEGFATAGLCYYRDGRDSVAWHGDTIGRGRTEDTLVAILSLGAARALLLRPRSRRCLGPVPHRARRPARHGRLLPAHLGARGAEDRSSDRPPDLGPVPPARRRLTPRNGEVRPRFYAAVNFPVAEECGGLGQRLGGHEH